MRVEYMKTPLESHKACSLRAGADVDLVLPDSGAGTDADLTIFCLGSQEMLHLQILGLHI